VSTPLATTPRLTATVRRDPRYLGWSFIAGAASLLAYGVVSAIIPNPVFGRQIPPEPFAIVVWLVSAALMGLIVGTYLAPGQGGSAGALTIWAPLQPILGAASLVLLAATLAWRLRVRARGGACPVR